MRDYQAVRHATLADMGSWLTLTAEVEPLFGPMPDFADYLKRGILRGTAFVSCGTDGTVTGGMLLSGSGAAKINWLAVRQSASRQGLGSALVGAAIAHFGGHRDILVDTFGADNTPGLPALRLYMSLGFLPAEELPPGPEGGSRQRLRRPPDST